MARPTFFFYDLETSGLNPADDRIMQFAGQRTTLNFKPIGDPINLLVKLADDTLPSPGAVFTTKITPQKTIEEGIEERELAKFLHESVFTSDTIILGFNSVRFDDRFIQHLFWRNFYDPYEWQWRDGRSRWDMLDVVRMTRALRPENINWPVTDEGKPTNRLELITKLNGISHEAAHDALSDVNALIDVTRLIRDRQPKLFDYLFKLRDKREVKTLLNLKNPTPFVYTSGRFGSAHNFTTVAFPLFTTKTGNLMVFDLRYNLDEILESQLKNNPDFFKDPSEKLLHSFFPIIKELYYNKCPAVAPLGVLDQSFGWKKIELSRDLIEKNLATLKNHRDLFKRLQIEARTDAYDKQSFDAEGALYDSFTPDSDKIRLSVIRSGTASSLADFHPNFSDDRLSELLLHYKAKNFPEALSDTESEAWKSYRFSRLNRQAPLFLTELKKFEDANADSFLIEELKLWYQSLQEADY